MGTTLDHPAKTSPPKTYSLSRPRPLPQDFSQYRGLISRKNYEEIIEKAKSLKGKRIAIVNATGFGGGVAEMLHAYIPLMQSLGVSIEWYVMPPNEKFFEITKKLHNTLQGSPMKLTSEEKDYYERHNIVTGTLLKELGADLMEIHDPQPLASRKMFGDIPAIWRCHIDTSTPNPAVWNYLRQFIESYDQLVFTSDQFVSSDLAQGVIEYITPSIDPFSLKNKNLPAEIGMPLLEKHGIDTRRPLITQISRFDPWKDPAGVIAAYRETKKGIPDLQLALVGSMASDDPEGVRMLEQVKRWAGTDPDIHIIVSAKNNDLEVNAFQAFSDVIVQKSIREGFGLTVTEALWKGQPVVAGNVGGIRLQIKNKENGFLVNSYQECSERSAQLLTNPQLKKDMSTKARETVRDNFLMPTMMLKHLQLYQRLLNVS